MEIAQSFSLLPGDPRLIDHIVCELKSQGIFDQFRKECIADVDTKPAYQNLRQRVEGSVAGFLSSQKWKPDLNKNQLRERLRKHIADSNFLDQGVERIVDQAVNPKIASVFLPQVEEVVYKCFGLEIPDRSNRNVSNGLGESSELKVSTDDLLPGDLEAVSPDSVKSHEKPVETSFEDIELPPDQIMGLKKEETEVKVERTHPVVDTEDSDDSKDDDFESPAFEPLDDDLVKRESPNHSQMSGMSDANSRDSDFKSKTLSALKTEDKESRLSRASSDSEVSIKIAKVGKKSLMYDSGDDANISSPAIKNSPATDTSTFKFNNDDNSSDARQCFEQKDAMECDDNSVEANFAKSQELREVKSTSSSETTEPINRHRPSIESKTSSEGVKLPASFDVSMDSNESKSSSIFATAKPETYESKETYTFRNKITSMDEGSVDDDSSSNGLKIDLQETVQYSEENVTGLNRLSISEEMSTDLKSPGDKPKDSRSDRSGHRDRSDSHKSGSKDERRSSSSHHSRDHRDKRDDSRHHSKSSHSKHRDSGHGDRKYSSSNDRKEGYHSKSSKDSDKDRYGRSGNGDSRKDSSDRTKSSSSRHSSSSKHYSSSKHDDSHRSRHSTSERSDRHTLSRQDSHKSERDKDSSKSSETRDASGKDKSYSSKHGESSGDRSKSSHSSQRDKSSSSKNDDKSRKLSTSDKKDEKKKDKSEKDDHYSSSGRGGRTRRSTDRDSNDGNNGSNKSSGPNSVDSSGSVNPSTSKDKSGSSSKDNSTNGNSSGQSDSSTKDKLNISVGGYIKSEFNMFQPVVKKPPTPHMNLHRSPDAIVKKSCSPDSSTMTPKSPDVYAKKSTSPNAFANKSMSPTVYTTNPMSPEAISKKPVIHIDSQLNPVLANEKNANSPPPQEVNKLKKPKFASNIYEARKLMKVRKNIDKIELKRKQDAQELIEKQNNVSKNESSVYSGVSGPELHISCLKTSPETIKKCAKGRKSSDTESDLLYFDEDSKKQSLIDLEKVKKHMKNYLATVNGVEQRMESVIYLVNCDKNLEQAFVKLGRKNKAIKAVNIRRNGIVKHSPEKVVKASPQKLDISANSEYFFPSSQCYVDLNDLKYGISNELMKSKRLPLKKRKIPNRKIVKSIEMKSDIVVEIKPDAVEEKLMPKFVSAAGEDQIDHSINFMDTYDYGVEYYSNMNDMLSRATKQDIMEIILGGEANFDASNVDLKLIKEECDSSINKKESEIKTASGVNGKTVAKKRKISFQMEEQDGSRVNNNNNFNSIEPVTKQQKFPEKVSSTEGLSRNNQKSHNIPSSPESDKSIENHNVDRNIYVVKSPKGVGSTALNQANHQMTKRKRNFKDNLKGKSFMNDKLYEPNLLSMEHAQ